MNAYVTSVIEHVKKKYAHEPEFCQTVEEYVRSHQTEVTVFLQGLMIILEYFWIQSI